LKFLEDLFKLPVAIALVTFDQAGKQLLDKSTEGTVLLCCVFNFFHNTHRIIANGKPATTSELAKNGKFLRT
jgi:hypothetical protein